VVPSSRIMRTQPWGKVGIGDSIADRLPQNLRGLVGLPSLFTSMIVVRDLSGHLGGSVGDFGLMG
jgi:hypothetical protein